MQGTRQLGMGDAFLFRGPRSPSDLELHESLRIFDITRAARAQGKCALYGAVAPSLRRREAMRRGLFDEEPDPDHRVQRHRAPGAVAVPEV